MKLVRADKSNFLNMKFAAAMTMMSYRSLTSHGCNEVPQPYSENCNSLKSDWPIRRLPVFWPVAANLCSYETPGSLGRDTGAPMKRILIYKILLGELG